MDRRSKLALSVAVLSLLGLLALRPPRPPEVQALPASGASSSPETDASSPGSPSAEPTHEGLFAVLDGAKVAPFVLDHSSVAVEIVGAFAFIELSQHYLNPHKERLEAVYTFPLPERAAVTDMYMRISSRVVTSEVHEREAAKRLYETAKSSGRAAALLEQERPNIFTQSVANIPPGEAVFVHLKMVFELPYDDGRYRFAFPMTVGPRFIPADAEGDGAGDGEASSGAAGPGANRGLGTRADSARVPDASRIVPQYLEPGERSGREVSVEVDLRPGVEIEGLRSLSHEVVVRRPAKGRARVSLKPFDRIPNKDFVLEWGVKATKPELAVAAHRGADGGFLMLTIQPPARPEPRQVTPKEMVFVVDTSGSMSGEPIAKVRQAMRRAIRGLNPGDSFQIIRFDQKASSFSPRPLPFNEENLRRGLAYIEQFEGAGGTNMIEGIEAALDAPEDPDRRRFVLFMTDGYIGNDAEILAAVQKKLRSTRLVSFGVGSSVNRYLLEEMGRVGRGFSMFVLHDEDAAPHVERFYKRLRRPLLLDLSVDWGGLSVREPSLERLPDLFDAEPLVLFARYDAPASGTVTVKGTLAGRPYQKRLAVTLPAKEAGAKALPVLWARRQVERLMTRMNAGEDPALAAQVKDLGLKFKLMTKYTSFVAVERFLKPDLTVPLQTVLIPSEMPEGVDFDKAYGGSATVSLPRMKPGDPVLSVDAPRDAREVRADFPFGPGKELAWDEVREKWVARFLVPRGTPDGRYRIAVTVVERDGRRRELEAFYVIDSKAPVFDVVVRKRGRGWLLVAKPRTDVLESGRGPRGAVTVVHDVKHLRARSAEGKETAFKLDKREDGFVWLATVEAQGTWTLEAADFAGNSRVWTVEVR